MASIINASTTTGLNLVPDNTGSLDIQTSGSPAITIDSSQNVNVVKAILVPSSTAGTAQPVPRNQADTLYAPLNGNINVTFSVAASTTGTEEAVPRNQADTLYAAINGTTNSSFYANSSSSANEGDIGAYAPGVASAYLYNNTSSWGLYSGAGGSLLSYTRSGPTVQVGNGIPVNVAAGTSGSEAINFSQVVNTTSLIWATHAGPNPGPTVATSGTFTAPSNGFLVIDVLAEDSTGQNTGASISTSLGGLIVLGSASGNYNGKAFGVLPMAAGQQTTVTGSAPSAASTGASTVFVTGFFIASP